MHYRTLTGNLVRSSTSVVDRTAGPTPTNEARVCLIQRQYLYVTRAVLKLWLQIRSGLKDEIHDGVPRVVLSIDKPVTGTGITEEVQVCGRHFYPSG
jgi:hypothetical protein